MAAAHPLYDAGVWRSLRRVGHPRACAAALAAVFGIALGASGPVSARAASSDAPEALPEADSDEPESLDEVHRRLTEREDEERPEDHLILDVLGRPLIISGQYEAGLFANQEPELDDDDEERPEDAGQAGLELEPRLNLGQELELEAFYAVAPWLSAFAQARLEYTQDLYRGESGRDGSARLERGEMWIHAENVADSHLGFDVGRLNFEDDRRWWWDDERDAVRVSYEEGPVEAAASLARELFRFSTEPDGIDPDDDGVLRLIGEASWQYVPFHQLDLFALRQWDQSSRQRRGHRVGRGDEDDSDASLTWLGLRLAGEFAWRLGSLGYWVDAAGVGGHERVVEYAEGPGRASVVEDTLRRSVRGWAFDGGVTWVFDALAGMRITLGYAIGSGDSDPFQGTDRSFRQTGLDGNQARLGGVEGFQYYGELLDPELSNLQIATVGWGLSLFESSSLDVVYHDYHQVERAPFLLDAGIGDELAGVHRSVGQELDLILAIEEWDRIALELRAAAFRKGAAFGSDRSQMEYGGFVLFRYAF